MFNPYEYLMAEDEKPRRLRYAVYAMILVGFLIIGAVWAACDICWNGLRDYFDAE